MLSIAAAFALLYAGRDVFIPLAIAFVFAVVLRPVVRRLEGWRIPTPVAAAALIILGLGMVWGVGYALTPAVQNFVQDAPSIATGAAAKLKTLPRPLDRIGTFLESATAAGKKVSAATDSTHHGGAGGAARADSVHASRDTSAAHGSSSGPFGTSGMILNVAGRVFGTAAGLASFLLEVTLLLLFFLASGDSLRKRLVKRGAHSAFIREVVAIGDEVQSIVSRYVSLLALINVMQGIVITIAMTLIGMPVPPVWGAMTFVAEFFPYLGSASMVILLTLVGLASTNGPHVLVPPAIYLGITTLQNSLVSPVTYGRRLQLNPAAILASVMIWWLMWGVFGAFLAVPILATVRVVCERQGGKLGAVAALIEA